MFVGREQELSDLHTLLQEENAVAISAISGMGGIGKTELAVQYAWKHLAEKTYPGGVVWLKAREDIAPQIVLFARSLPMPQPPDDFELAAKVAFYWRNWQDAKTLVILDDVQDYGAIKPLLPVDSHFKILLTTRLTPQSPVQNFEIKVLSEENAISLLRAIVLDGRIDQNLATAKQICEWLGYLPLGLELVGRYLARKPDTSLATLWQRLQDKRLDAKALKDATPEMTATLGVTAAFELSWDVLDESAQRLAALLSLFALAEIPWTLVEACLPEDDPEALEDRRDESLLNLHLLERTRQGMYQLHQLLREFFAAKREQRADVDLTKQTLCRVMAAVAEPMPIVTTRSQIEQFTAVIPHLKEATTTLQPWLTDADVFKLATRIAQFYEGQVDYCQALFWYQHCRETSEDRLGSDHPDVAITLNNLAGLYRVQGRYSEAEPLHLRSLDIDQCCYGDNHPAIATDLNNLVLLYTSQGRYSEAESLHLRCLEIEKRTLGENQPRFAMGLNSLAGIYRSQGRYSEAEPLCLRALSIQEWQLGTEHPDVAQSLNNLAALYESQGRYSEAEPLYLRSLTIYEQQFGKEHPHIASSLNNLAGLYRVQGRYSEAEPLCQRSLTIYEQQLGAEHPHVASSLNNLASLYESQGRTSEAELLYLRSFTILEQQFGTEHPHIASSLNNLAELYRLQGRTSEAEPLRLRGLEIEKETLGENHPQFASSLNNLALLYESQGRASEAEPLYLRSLQVMEQQLGADHSDTAITLNNLAALYKFQGRYSEAESLYQRSLGIVVINFGLNHPKTQHVRVNLAILYDSMATQFKLQGRFDKAVEYLEKAITLRTAVK
ncbi:tetratricopeptide repeat protein [Leptolyngbyaceae cyanobacterium UHCC 1019]